MTVERTVSPKAKRGLCLDEGFLICFPGTPAAHTPHHGTSKGPGLLVPSERVVARLPKGHLLSPYTSLWILNNAIRLILGELLASVTAGPGAAEWE